MKFTDLSTVEGGLLIFIGICLFAFVCMIDFKKKPKNNNKRPGQA